MPSPIGHTIAGLCGVMLVPQTLSLGERRWLLLASVAIANLPDIDILPGLLLGDPRAFHRQGSHSLTAALAVGGLVALLGSVLKVDFSWAKRRKNQPSQPVLNYALVKYWKLNPIRWGVWAAALYASHIVLDMLVADPSPPRGIQLLWPLSETYFSFPISLFGRFDYFDPSLGMVRSILSLQNVFTVLREIILMVPLVWLTQRFTSKSYK
jgi:inner membrane protein